MLSEIAKPGDKVEIVKVESGENNENFDKITTYFSKIYDIIEEDKMKIAMPTEGTRMVPLELNDKYEICMYTSQGLYRCRAVMTERYKEDNIYVAIMELYTGVQKYQRRQHYRLECNIELRYRVLTEDEKNLLLSSKTPETFQNEVIGKGQIRGITLDISGGGIRFISQSPDVEGEHLLVEFDIQLMNVKKHFSIVAVQIDTRRNEKKRDIYEHRVQFENISQREREDLIKYIFEEERRFRRNEKG